VRCQDNFAGFLLTSDYLRETDSSADEKKRITDNDKGSQLERDYTLMHNCILVKEKKRLSVQGG